MCLTNVIEMQKYVTHYNGGKSSKIPLSPTLQI